MGEAFKRNRAMAFEHRRHRYYQALITQDLLRISRVTRSEVELNLTISQPIPSLTVGSHCIITQRDDRTYDLVCGNLIIATLPDEGAEVIANYAHMAPHLSNVYPCHVTRLTPFGGVSVEIDAESGRAA